jgi:hypothetical protein
MEKGIVMRDLVNVSRHCANALLDAYYRSDSALMRQLADQANLMRGFYVTDPAESERLELLGAIAVEMHRSCSLAGNDGLDPYVRLLINLANPDGVAAHFMQSN